MVIAYFLVLGSAAMAQNSPQTLLSTKLYCKVIDQRGIPVPGDYISAEYTDPYGINRNITTRSLSTGEARSMGNRDLAGYYLFNDGVLETEPGSAIKIRPKPAEDSEEAGSRNSSLMLNLGDKANESFTNEDAEKNPESKEQVSDDLIEENDNKSFSIPDRNFKGFWVWPIAIMALFFGVYALKRGKFRLKRLPPEYRLYKSIGSLMDGEIKNFMAKKVTAISKEDSVMDALSTMISGDVRSLIVLSGKKPIGIVNEEDFLHNVYTREKFDALKVKDVMFTDIMALPEDSTLQECMLLMLKIKFDCIPIVNGDSLSGIIHTNDMLDIFYTFFSKNIIDSPNIPQVGAILKKDFNEIDENVKLAEALSYMIWKKTGYLLIKKLDKLGNVNLRIVSARNSLNDFYKNQNRMFELKIKQTTMNPIKHVTPVTTIFDAAKIMIECDNDILAVVEKDKIAGIIDKKILISSMYDFVRQLLGISENKLRKMK